MNWRPLLSYRKEILATIAFALLCLPLARPASGAGGDDSSPVWGPENLMKTMKTPFTTKTSAAETESQSSSNPSNLSPIGISARTSPAKRSLLSERFHGPVLYLPASMVLGHSVEFIVKGTPGSYAAIAMADKNEGAKPVYGHKLRLGPDRKLVAINKIPDTGIASMFVETPIQGDLVGSPLFFEAAVWSKPDFSDLQIASTISTQEDARKDNGVILSEQEEKKDRVIKLGIPEPMSLKTVGSMSSGRP